MSFALSASSRLRSLTIQQTTARLAEAHRAEAAALGAGRGSKGSGDTSIRIGMAVVLISIAAAPAFAQSRHYGVGRPATAEEIKAWDIAVAPDGQQLPSGSGTAVRGKEVYAAQCARCHGATAREGPEAPLVGGKGTLNSDRPLKTVGSYWPYATTVWDYVNRAMPFDRPGTLNAADVYAAVAYVLFLNGIVGERDTLDRQTLPQIQMPNRNGFVPDPRPDVQPPKAETKPVPPRRRNR